MIPTYRVMAQRCAREKAQQKKNANKRLIKNLVFGSAIFAFAISSNVDYAYLLRNVELALFDDISMTMADNSAVASFETDSLGMTAQQRKQRISSLLISPQNKRDLLAGRPFWGAAKHMTELALSKRAKHVSTHSQKGITFEFQTFNLRSGSAVFEYQNNRLTCLHYETQPTSICDGFHHSLYPQNNRVLFSASISRAALSHD